jgi:uncharacterized protein (DUF3084 family)
MFNNVTLLFFLLLIPLSGFIAWAGDRIGHKSGKRRHSLFGLRPRHTAMLFTIGTGVCISLVSFGLVWAFSKSFRVVLREGADLVHKNRELKGDNARLTTGNEVLRDKSSELARQADASQQEAAARAAEARQADARRDLAVGRAEKAEQAARQAETQAARAQARLQEETRALRLAQAGLTRLKGQLGVRAEELHAAEARVRRAEIRVADAEKQVGQAERRVADARGKAQQATADLQRVKTDAERALKFQKEQLDKRLADLQQQLAEQTKLYDEQKQGITEQSAALAQLNQQVMAGQQELALIRENIGALRARQITYQRGEEVARIAVRSGYNIWRVEAILGAFLTTAAKKAEARGAGRAKDGEERAVVILPRLIKDDGPAAAAASDEQRVATEDDSLRAAAAAIRSANTEVVVLAQATANAVAGEPVPVEFKIYKNPVVLTAETAVGEAAIDGTGSRQQIADALYNFLHQNVRRSLLRAGIIPPARGGDAAPPQPPTNAAAPDTDEGSAALISLSGDEWLQIMDKVREAGPRARVVARAARDLRAGDAVSLRFEVRGGTGGVQSAILRAAGN